MRSYIIKMRVHEYRVAVDLVTHKDGSQSRVVFCNNQLMRGGLEMSSLPKTIQNAVSRELDAR